MQLQRLVDDLDRSFGCEIFCHGSSLGGVFLVVHEPCCVVDKVSCRVELGLHIRHHECQSLVLAKRLAELDAVLGVLNSQVQSFLRDAQCHGSDADTAYVQSLHSVDEAHVLLSEQAVCGNADIFQYQIADRNAVLAHLLLVLAYGYAGQILGDDESADALCALIRIRLSIDDVIIRDGSHCDEALYAVEDVAVAVLDCLCLEGARIGTCVGLGQSEGDLNAAVSYAGKIFCLLLFCSGQKDRLCGQRVRGRDEQSSCRALLSDFFHNTDIAAHIKAQSAVLLRDLQAVESELSHLLDDFFRKYVGLVDLACDAGQCAFRKLLGHLAD